MWHTVQNSFKTFTPAATDVVILLAMLFTIVIVLAWRYIRKGETKHRSQKIRQPVADNATGSDPEANARVYLGLYDRKARDAKDWYDRFQILALVAPLLAAIFEGHASSWMIRALAGSATFATGFIAYKKFDLMWLSFRRTAHDLSFLILELAQGQVSREEFKKRYMDIIRDEAARFQIVASQKRESSSESSGQSSHH